MKTNRNLILLLLSITAILSFTSCSKDHSSSGGGTTSKEGYRIMAYTDDSKGWGQYLLPFDSLMSGSISPVNYGWDVTGTLSFNGTFYHKGYYYFLQDNQFNKYKVDTASGQLVRVAAAVFPYFSNGQRYWVDDNTLMLVGSQDSSMLYAIVDVSNMSITSEGKLNIPFYSGPKAISPYDGTELTVGWAIDFVKVDGDKVLIGYNYDTYPYLPGIEDAPYYAEMDYPTMTNVTIKQNTTFGMISSSTFQDENGDLYVATYNWGIANPLYSGSISGYTPKADGLIRIKKGGFYPDTTYFLEVPSNTYVNATSDHGVQSCYYIGNGKALMMSSDYVIVDVNTKEVVKNLAEELPPLVTTYGSDYALTENNKLYVALITQSQGANIYEYDPATDKLTKGLEIDGGVARLSLLHAVENE